MSVIAPAERRVWMPLAAAAIMIAIVAAATLTRVGHREHAGSSSDAGSAGIALGQQADWRISVRPAGVRGRLHKDEQRAIADQRHALRGLVRDLYGALFLNRDRIDNVLAARFSKPAATTFRRARAGIPPKMTGIETTRRVAHISVQASGVKRGVASVTVVANGTMGARELRIVHRSRLWLERTGKHWKIIAFDVDQEPVK